MIFRSLETRIIVFFVVLLATVQVTAFLLVSTANQAIAKREVINQAKIGERVFKRLLEQNGRQLSQAAAVLAADFGFREAIATRDVETIVSVLGNHGARINANLVILADLNNKLLADTRSNGQTGRQFPFPDLIAEARGRRQASAVVLVDNQLYQLVVVPVLAPLPIAWVAMGFTIDDQQAQDLRELTSLHVSFLTVQTDGNWHLSASTLPVAERADLSERLPKWLLTQSTGTLTIGEQEYETTTLALDQEANSKVIAVLQQSLRTVLEPFNELRNILLALMIASIVASLLGSILIGRSLVKPINSLVAVAHKIRDGDYTQAVDIKQDGEIGELALSLDSMREAISTREEKILNLAYQDTLTGLPNRVLFNDRLEAEIKDADRDATPVTILTMDLDRFKYINETLSHAIGDKVLQAVGSRLKGLLRKWDTVARLGGDEFAVILPKTGLDHAQEIGAKILGALESPITIDNHLLDVGVSIGIAAYPDHGSDALTVIRHADIAMYIAKRSNKGCATYHPDYQPRDDYLTLLGELRYAVEQDELSLYYQPIVSLETGAMTQAEALLRWVHPKRGIVLPIKFIPFSEQTGYISAITRWVIRQAIRQCGLWRDRGMDITVSVNISSRDLVNPELPELVRSGLETHALDPQKIGIEITESAFMEDPAQALEILKRLDSLGVNLSIDDYGTGYSSLSYLKRLPVKGIKIDRSFIESMGADENDTKIVKSTIDLGHSMGLQVTAEGVEDMRTWNLLKQLGCDHAQGHYMSTALSTNQFEKWVAENRIFGGARVQPIRTTAE